MRLKELRIEKNLRQEDVAQMLGLERSTYTKYESGASRPKSEILVELSRFYNVSVDYILENTDRREKPTPADGDGLDAKKILLIQKIIGLNKGELETLIQVADSVLAKRGK